MVKRRKKIKFFGSRGKSRPNNMNYFKLNCRMVTLLSDPQDKKGQS